MSKQMYQYFDSYRGNKDYKELDNPIVVFVAALSIFVSAYLILISLPSIVSAITSLI